MSTAITEVRAREILDSRGNPTVEVDITTEEGVGVSEFVGFVLSGAGATAHWPQPMPQPAAATSRCSGTWGAPEPTGCRHR